MGVKKLPKVKELQTEYAKLLEEKKKTYSEYRRSREEMRELLTAKANVDRVLKMEVEMCIRDRYGTRAAYVILSEDGAVVMNDCYNGFDAVSYTHLREKQTGQLS